MKPSTRRPVRGPLLAAAIALAVAAPYAGTETANATAGNGKRAEAQAATDRFIVKFKAGAAERGNAAQRQQRLDAIGHAQGLRVSQMRRLALGADVIRTDRKLGAQDAKDFIGRLRRDPRVEYAEIDARMQPNLAPNDTLVQNQWHYLDTTYGINLAPAWDRANGAGQVVAVVDTGITAHSDLNANVVTGYDFITDAPTANDGDGRDANPSDPGDWVGDGECGSNMASSSSWHGTHVAGTIAAVTNNGQGVAGIAWGAKVQPVRVLGKCGGFVSDIADGIVWASGGAVPSVPGNATPADVINLSLGGSGACGATYQAAIDTAIANGALVVVSAGNDNNVASAYSPGNCAGVLTVAASGRTGARAGYSNFGLAVGITAPGGDSGNGVLSTFNGGATVPGGESYGYYSGTSMAAPHVSGVAALVRELSGGSLTPAEISELLQATSRTLPLPCAQGCGAGLLDANAATAAASLPIITVRDPVADAEGDAGTTVRTFEVRLSKALASPITFRLDTINQSATAGSDYVALSQDGEIPAGSTSASFDVTVNGDTALEGDETFFVLAHDFTFGGYAIVDDLATVTIFDDETIPLEVGIPRTVTDSVPNHNRHFTLEVPANATNLRFDTDDGSGDVDLYVRKGAVATETENDCAPFLSGNRESCLLPVQGGGTFHVMLDVFEPYAGVTLTGTYTVPVDVSITDGSVVEGGPGDSPVIAFTVNLSQPTGLAVPFQWASADGTATQSDGDYDYTNQLGAVPAGSTSVVVQIPVNGDATAEANETVMANLLTAGGTVTDSQGVGTILDDDTPISLSIDDQGGNEGDSGTSQQVFTISLSRASPVPVTFDVATSGGSATPDVDFVTNSSLGVSIAAGDLSATVAIDIHGDTTLEGDETYTVGIYNALSALVADGTGTGTIISDDLPTLSIADAASITEGDAGTKVMTFTATLSQAVGHLVVFDAATDDGTASYQDDYVGGSAYGLQIPAGQTSKTFSVTINGDTDVEADETLVVNISGASGAAIIDAQGEGTILDDDTPTLSIDDVTSNEGDSGTPYQDFTITLSAPSATDVQYSVSSYVTPGTATNNVDYHGNGVVQTIPAGATSTTFTMMVIGDTAIEADETYNLVLSSPVGATIADGTGVGTIVNDDFPALSIGDAAVTEGDSGSTTLTYTVTLSRVSIFPVGFDIATANGTASSASDYAAASATGQVIAAGQLSRTFSVTINGDGAMENHETVLANVGNVAGATVADSQGVGTITNDDGTLSIGNTSVTEGNAGTSVMSFVVSLSQASTAPVFYNARTTATGSTAVAGSDYVASTLTNQSIPAGQTSKVFNVTINGDSTLEADEVVTALLGATGVVIGTGTASGTIVNDDGATLSIANAGFQEGNSGTKILNFTVTLSQAAAIPVTFSLRTAPGTGTATAGTDYVARTYTPQTIAAGQLTKTFAITVNGDTTVEGNETFFVWISNASVSILDGQARGLIVNDDGPVLSIGDAVISEGNSGTKLMTFTVSLSKAAVAPVTYNLATINLTATGGVDYQGSNPTGLTIPAGQLSKTFTVVVNGDTTVEANETLQVNLSLGNVSILDGVGVGTITNDD